MSVSVQVGDLVPWLDWAEEKVAADLPRPAQLQEATEILQQCQDFEDQCIDKEPAVKVRCWPPICWLYSLVMLCGR